MLVILVASTNPDFITVTIEYCFGGQWALLNVLLPTSSYGTHIGSYVTQSDRNVASQRSFPAWTFQGMGGGCAIVVRRARP